jgi:hypothetical protein
MCTTVMLVHVQQQPTCCLLISLYLSQFVVKQQLCIQTKRPPKVGKKTGVIDLFSVCIQASVSWIYIGAPV